ETTRSRRPDAHPLASSPHTGQHPPMPRPPHVAPSLAAVGGSVFSHLARRLEEHPGEVYPLHVGDTWLDPAPGCRMEDLTVADHPGLHRYAPPQGVPELLAALAERLARRTGVATSPDEVMVAAGATGALGTAIGALVSPGEEVLVLAPH